MDRIVIDSGVIVKWFLNEPDSDKANIIRDDFDAGNLDLVVPDVIVAEVGNIAWKRHTVIQDISSNEAQRIITGFLALGLETVPNSELLAAAYDLAVTHGRSVYDSLYLALSIREGCRFVTADRKLARKVGPILPNVVLLADWS
jgi:predicted nucleic acid-binding protein